MFRFILVLALAIAPLAAEASVVRNTKAANRPIATPQLNRAAVQVRTPATISNNAGAARLAVTQMLNQQQKAGTTIINNNPANPAPDLTDIWDEINNLNSEVVLIWAAINNIDIDVDLDGYATEEWVLEQLAGLSLGSGAKGDQGEPGPQGIQGEQGVAGPAGPQGEPGTLADLPDNIVYYNLFDTNKRMIGSETVGDVFYVQTPPLP
ncbi:MAG: collagen-like protein [Alphaproteobacteria bacterium]|nr:collagen-like protein [Alphaproteobacteria bacterium]